MKQKDWKIIYTKYEGLIKKAVNFLSKEAGATLIRVPNVYTIYVLPCEREGCAVSKNAFFVGCYDDSPMIQKFVKADEIPENGYLVKVVENPDDAEEGRFVIITAHDAQNVFYAAVSFIDDYIPANAQFFGANKMPDFIFDRPLTVASYSHKFDYTKRNIFTWGHSINDYRKYLDNMARLKLNVLYLWNDYIPINIDDIIDYAHSYGIKVILGYSWGWKEIGNKATEITDEKINEVKELVIRQYREDYAHVKCDGIYFQTFTERNEQSLNGRNISELAVEMVNDVAERIWEINPSLHLVFGLHSTSVCTRLDDIAKVNPKIEILWEDCGKFPFNYVPYITDFEGYEQSKDFIKEILKLRGGANMGILLKSSMMLDWSAFVNQHGPYVMGENSSEVAEHDRRVRAKSWRWYCSEWTKFGVKAHEILNIIKENKIGDVDLGIAGTYDGGICLPTALCAEMIRDCSDDFADILKRVSARPSVTLD